MKKGILFIFLFCVTTLIFGQGVEPAKINVWHLMWAVVVPIIAGLYEVIVRIVPTVINYSFIGKIIEILLWLSNFFNRKKKK